MLQGKLLSDEEMVNLMDKVLDLIDTKARVRFGRLPAHRAASRLVAEQAHRGRFALTARGALGCFEDVVRSRLLDRARQDDTEDAIAKRFSEYNTVTLPILEHPKREGAKVCKIDAAQEVRACCMTPF